MQRQRPGKKSKSSIRRTFERYVLLALTALTLFASLAIIALLPARSRAPAGATRTPAPSAGATAPAATPSLDPNLLALPPGGSVPGSDGIALARAPEPFTFMPERDLDEVRVYTVQQGDTIFGIAQKFNIKPETLFWGNPDINARNLQFLQLGMELRIMPADGVIHLANGQQTLADIAAQYGVDPYDIIFSEYNNLPADIALDTKLPYNTQLVFIGVEGAPIDVGAPVVVEGSGVGGGSVKVSGGPGSCGLTTVHTAGRSVFSLPLSGGYTFMQDFYPGIHNGVDLAGSTGDGVIAADGGTVVFAGLHNGGYGYLVVIDHGNGFQTYYGHLSRVGVRCGAGVSAGQYIGAMGSTGNSTGPHLHFEIQQGGVPVSPHIHLIL
ncbi:MAG: peptidoglycan DD-metalloendopeptidase family protein [Anaerolineae bacterium]|nr:peptidoglycan DD-metalloendopeptidase family protein [Anaerolineae bacterium]